MKAIFKGFIVVSILILCVLALFSFNVIWKSPPYYHVKDKVKLDTPVMDMQSYKQIISTHRRPYCYSIHSKSGGKVYVLGIEHLKRRNHPQLDTIRKLWNKANPTVALVEGRMGFLFTWFEDPIEKYGEGGLLAKLAKSNGVNLYTWEPTRNDEIEILMKQFPVEQIAMFYVFRPYFSNIRHGKPANPENKLQEYLNSRTDYEHIKGVYQSWEELDSAWQNDFPNINWRDYSDEKGWPEGYLYEIWNASNLSRDVHLVQVIIDLVEKGESVIVTMGSSHAPRIENALRVTIN